MENKLHQNLNEINIDEYIADYKRQNFSLNILEKNFNNNYFLIVEITPLNYSKNKIILNVIKYDGTHIPKSTIKKILTKNLNKCKRGKISNNWLEKFYIQLRFPKIYKKYYKFDNTVIIIIAIIVLLIFGVIWSSYHNIITDYMLTH